MWFCWGVFSCSHTVLPKEHSLFFFFSSLSSCYAVIFFNSLSSCPVYPLVIYVCYVWAGWWLISLVLVTSDNKGLLLLLQINNFMLTRLLVNNLLVNIAYMKIWVLATIFWFGFWVLAAPVQPVQKVSLKPCCNIYQFLWGYVHSYQDSFNLQQRQTVVHCKTAPSAQRRWQRGI